MTGDTCCLFAASKLVILHTQQDGAASGAQLAIPVAIDPGRPDVRIIMHTAARRRWMMDGKET